MRISDWSSDVCSSDLLNAFAGNIASDRGAVALARDLIDLVDIDDALLRFFDVAVCGLQKFGDDAFDIFADIAGLGQRGGVDHDEWHVESARSEEHTSELQSLMRISYAVFCLKKKKNKNRHQLKTNPMHK